MRIQAPFILHEVQNTDPAQASHTKFFLAPFCVWRRKVFAQYPKTRWLVSFDYDRSRSGSQYIGSLMSYAGRESWRQF